MFAGLHAVENILRWLGGLLAFAALALIFWGILQGMRRSAGKTAGSTPGLLRSPLFYLVSGSIFFGVGYWLWRPLPLGLPPPEGG